jgi:hypothetical protein
MVYSSPATVSSEVIVAFNEKLPPISAQMCDHAIKDVLRICDACLSGLAEKVDELPASYVAAHLARHEDQRSDIADVDAGISSWIDVVYPFGCWLKTFPDVDVNRKFYALDLGELFEKGLRFIGRASFGEPEFSHFLSRFATGTSNWTDEFVRHFGNHIIVDNETHLKELAKVRAVVFDVSVFLAAREMKEP